jgi:FkbM family methyltransferase
MNIPDYEKMLEMVYNNILKRGDVVLDIGAHIGRHTFPIAEAVGPGGKVFAFEPLPKQFQVLNDNIEIYSQKKGVGTPPITPFNFALGEEDGSTNFIVAENYPEFSGLQKRDYHIKDVITKEIKVEIRKLDSIKSDFGKVNYIKVDAEGGELQILRGGYAMISESRPIVSFELGEASLINYPYSTEDYYTFFEKLDYKIHSIFGIHITRSEFLKATCEQFYWDYIAIPSESKFEFNHKHIKVILNISNE